MFVMFNVKSKLNLCITVLILISLLVTGYIFYNSCQSPVESNENSDVVSEIIQPIIDPGNKINEKDFRKYTRKAAHVIEFLALGISLGLLFMCIYKKLKKIFVSLPLFLALTVAVTDEFIQSLNGRTSCLKDVLIDFSGSLVGFLLVLISVVLYSKINKEKTKKVQKSYGL